MNLLRSEVLDETAEPARQSQSRPRVLLVCYYCSPTKGSDWRVGWGWATEAARRYEAVVITSELSRPDIETYLSEYGKIPHLRFLYVGQSAAGRWLGKLPRFFLYTNPFSYSSWQSQVLAFAHKLHGEQLFNVAHQVTLIGFREPGKLYELGIPFIWGPIGGTQNFPARFLRAAGLVGGLQEAIRSVCNFLQFRYSRKVRSAMRKAAVVLAANSEGKRAIEHVYCRDAVQLLETGIEFVSPKPVVASASNHLRILWSGDLAARKAPQILLRALGTIRNDIKFELRIWGRGPLRKKLEMEARQLGIHQSCKFVGWLPLKDAMAQSEWADVFAFTSLRDTSGNVMLEAMSRGTPVICFDHQGAADIVTESSGIKIPVTYPEDAIQRWASALTSLAQDRRLLRQLSEGALSRAEFFLWSRNGSAMSGVYDTVLSTAKSAVGRRR